MRKALSRRGILTGGGPEEGRAVWGPQVANLGGVGGTERSVTCHQQSAPQSTTAAYIHPDSHCAPCGDKDAAISECEEGAGSGFHSLKPEWAISMLYGLLHTAVRRGEFESFRGTASPLGTAVKVKVLPQTHTQFFTSALMQWILL